MKKTADWLEANTEIMKPALEAKRSALVDYEEKPSVQTLSAMKDAKKTAQRTARSCANDYWLCICHNIQHAADTGNARGMFEGIKMALGPTVKKSAPLKLKTDETITDRIKQMDR